MSDGEAFEPIEDVVAEAKRAARAGHQPRHRRIRHDAGRDDPDQESRRLDDHEEGREREHGRSRSTIPNSCKARPTPRAARSSPPDATDKAARVKSALATLRTQARASLGGETKTPRYQWFLLPGVRCCCCSTRCSIERRGRRRVAAPRPRRRPPRRRCCSLLSLNGCARCHADAAGASRRTSAANSRSAASLFRDAITAGDKSPETLYNFGTALVAADSIASGRRSARPR